MPTWTPLQQEAERAFVDDWRRFGLDVDPASLTYPGEYHYVPEYLATHDWDAVERDVGDLLGTMGLDSSRFLAQTEFIPEYVTAMRQSLQ